MATAGVGIVSLRLVVEAIAAEAAWRPITAILPTAAQYAPEVECAPVAEPEQTAALPVVQLAPARLMQRPMRRLRIVAVVVNMPAAVGSTGNQ
jgi:hypothetical protein